MSPTKKHDSKHEALVQKTNNFQTMSHYQYNKNQPFCQDVPEKAIGSTSFTRRVPYANDLIILFVLVNSQPF